MKKLIILVVYVFFVVGFAETSIDNVMYISNATYEINSSKSIDVGVERTEISLNKYRKRAVIKLINDEKIVSSFYFDTLKEKVPSADDVIKCDVEFSHIGVTKNISNYDFYNVRFDYKSCFYPYFDMIIALASNNIQYVLCADGFNGASGTTTRHDIVFTDTANAKELGDIYVNYSETHYFGEGEETSSMVSYDYKVKYDYSNGSFIKRKNPNNNGILNKLKRFFNKNS